MLSQSAYLFVSRIIGFGIRLFVPVVLVRVLSKSDMGLYSQFFVVESILATVFSVGISQSQYFFVPRDPDNAGGIFVNTLLMSLAFYVFGYLCIGVFRLPIAAFLGMPVLSDYFWQIVLFGVFLMLSTVSVTYLIARKSIVSSAVAEIGVQAVASMAAVATAVSTHNLNSILISLIVGRIVGFAGLLIYVHYGEHGFESKSYRMDVRLQLRYGVVLGMSGSVFIIMMRMNHIFVSKFYDLDTYAVYAQGLKQIPVLQLYSQSVIAVALVQFAQLYHDDDWTGIKELWRHALAAFYGVGIPTTVLMILVAPSLVVLMYTNEYSEAIGIFQLNAVAMLFQLLNPALMLRAMDRNDVTLKVHLLFLFLFPVVLYTGMKAYGLYGVIGAHALVLIGVRVTSMVYLNRISPIHFDYLPSCRSIVEFYRSSWHTVLKKLHLVLSS